MAEIFLGNLTINNLKFKWPADLFISVADNFDWFSRFWSVASIFFNRHFLHHRYFVHSCDTRCLSIRLSILYQMHYPFLTPTKYSRTTVDKNSIFTVNGELNPCEHSFNQNVRLRRRKTIKLRVLRASIGQSMRCLIMPTLKSHPLMLKHQLEQEHAVKLDSKVWLGKISHAGMP